jgi:hypothetical protein
MEYFTKQGILDLDGPITDSNTCHGTEATAACLEFVDFCPECAISCAARGRRCGKVLLFLTNAHWHRYCHGSPGVFSHPDFSSGGI